MSRARQQPSLRSTGSSPAQRGRWLGYPAKRWARCLGLAVVVAAAGCAVERVSRVPEKAPPPPPIERPAPPSSRLDFEATAYSIEGTTKSGAPTRAGIVAADPKILPLGSRIRVLGAGSYSGIYTVADTGRTIRGQEIDIYIENGTEARRFGRRAVQVEVLERGSR